MEINFLVMEKSWKIIVEKEWSPCIKHKTYYGIHWKLVTVLYFENFPQ